jgi:hypothetical protein
VNCGCLPFGALVKPCPALPFATSSTLVASAITDIHALVTHLTNTQWHLLQQTLIALAQKMSTRA